MGPFLPPSSPTGGIDFRDILAEIHPHLNAAGPADLVYWTETELYDWADEAAKRLARKFGGFVERDGTALVASQAVYTQPARHISTIHASIMEVFNG